MEAGFRERDREAEMKSAKKSPKQADTFRQLVKIIHKYFDMIDYVYIYLFEV